MDSLWARDPKLWGETYLQTSLNIRLTANPTPTAIFFLLTLPPLPPRPLRLICQHRLVLETLKPFPQDRKCFRMINGVLVERTVKDVMPALATNSEGLKKVLDDLVKQYKWQQEEMEKWKVCATLWSEFLFAASLTLRLTKASPGFTIMEFWKNADFIPVLEEEQHTGGAAVTCSFHLQLGPLWLLRTLACVEPYMSLITES